MILPAPQGRIVLKNNRKVCVGRDAHIPPSVELTKIREVTHKYIQDINTLFDNVAIDQFTIMPNHIHLMIVINEPPEKDGMRASRPYIANPRAFVKNNDNQNKLGKR